MGNSKIFVGNVAYNTRKESIEALFAAHGTVTDCYKPEAKGFAFVTMSTPEEAEAALNALQGTVVDGRPLKLDVARPREDKPRRFDRGPRSYGSES